MSSKILPEKSEFHKHIENVITTEFKDIKFLNGKSLIIGAMDETNVIYTVAKGSKEDVTLAFCELFQAVSKLDREFLCEKFAMMLDSKNVELVYNAILERDDFAEFGDDDDDDDDED